MDLEDSLSDEIEIVWLDNPNKYRYLREGWSCEKTPAEFETRFSDRKVIGYSVHRSDGSGSYKRRYWYLMNNDPDLDDRGPYATESRITLKSCPAEAVVPNLIRVGHPSPMYRDYLRRKKKKGPWCWVDGPSRL